ncbi:MAG: GNAT family N-acetyltransferase [Deltaproteobacteria bacterium]|nr:GNAT family N-acetyltransferase [Deltaproteobacteria bacterium]
MDANTAINIRKVISSDREAIAGIVNHTENLTQEEKDCAVELLDIYLDNPGQRDYSFSAAAAQAGEVAGYVCYGNTPLTDGVYDLYWIVVAPSQRGKGVGRRLLEHTEAVLKKEGARMIVAETSGMPQYEAARVFYFKNGYREEARINGFYKQGDDLIVYVKRF